jgi:hypothetical protein
MKKSLLIGLAALSIAAPSYAASTVEASMASSTKLKMPCLDNFCTGPIKLSQKLAHTIAISEAEEDQLDADTSITLLGMSLLGSIPIDVRIGEDPNFQPGDTSANIQKTISVASIPEPIDMHISAKISWKDGELDIQASSQITGILSTSGISFAEKTRQVKDDVTAPLQTTIQDPGLATINVTAQLLVDISLLEAIQLKSDGAGSIRIGVSIKSNGLAVP